MDILLNEDGDVSISDGDIMLKDSVLQKIKIRLRWFLGEWRWNREEGIPYYENLLVKSPDTYYFERIIREKISEVEDVIDVKNVEILSDSKERTALIKFVAVTKLETIKGEVSLNV